MLVLLLQLATQAPLQRQILEAEHSRAEDIAPLRAGLASGDPSIQRLAVRAIGRLERQVLGPMLLPLLNSPTSAVRRETVNALGQLKTAFSPSRLLQVERDAGVRAVIYATIGRLPPVAGESERLLLSGLAEPNEVRVGAARGLDFLYRINRSVRPDSLGLIAMRRAFRESPAADIRQYLLSALNTARDRDSATLALALADSDPQVRRLAIIANPKWIDDPSALVRYEVLRLAGSCERAVAAVEDVSGHVSLLAVDQLATRRCEPELLLPLLTRSEWRVRAHALVALARVAPEAARARVPTFASDTIWQVRVYAANAATIIKDFPTLARLAADKDPNVVIAAMTTSAEALEALRSNHNGLLLKAAQVLKGKAELADAEPKVVATLLRLHAANRATLRDAKMELLLRFGEVGRVSSAATLQPLLSDVDPDVAKRAAEMITKVSGTPTLPITTRYRFPALPSDQYLKGLQGATATVTMHGLGTFTLELLSDDAIASVATFAQTAEAGTYNGVTIHRIVPNFLIQGGSPGADEYDGATTAFMPEEVGLLWHDRGTMGTSTRGHDTGDGQFYINLIDNYRLDNTYTLYARVRTGMDVVDRIQEGDVIESVKITRRPS